MRVHILIITCDGCGTEAQYRTPNQNVVRAVHNRLKADGWAIFPGLEVCATCMSKDDDSI